MMGKTVVIIIPTYNDGVYLTDCLSSCVSQTYENLEIIIVDDGSTDDRVATIIRSFEEKDSRIRSYRQENAGPGSARNRALSMISNIEDKYICFVDSDDWIEARYVERLVSALETNSADIVCGSASVPSDYIASAADAVAHLCYWNIPMGVYDKLLRGSAIPNEPFGTWSRFGEDTVAFFRCYINQGPRVFVSNESYGYHYENRNDSATHEPLTSIKAIEYLYLWSIICYEYFASFKERSMLSDQAVYWRFGSELLHMEPIAHKAKALNYNDSQRMRFIHRVVKENRVIFRFAPKTFSQWAKKWLRILFPELYLRFMGKSIN